MKQQARPPCPSPTPGVHSNSCPSSQWCHPAISSSVALFSFCLQSFPASGLFQWVSSLPQMAFRFSISPSKEYSGLISFRIDWLISLLSNCEMMLPNCGAGEDSWEFMDSKEIKPVNLKGNQPWILFGRTDAEGEAPILWPPDVNKWLIGKDLDAVQDWRQKEKRGQKIRWLDGITDSMDMNLGILQEMVRNRDLAWWGREESDTTWWLNNSTLFHSLCT